jgi:hypothetical protein
MLIITFLAILVLLFLLTGLRIANQYERAVIFRLGKYARTSGPGLYLLIPLIEWQWTIDMRTMTTAVEQQEAITKDNVPVKINAVIWRKTIDPKRAVIEVVDVGNSVVQVAVTALRNVIGQHTLDDVLKEQEAISRALQTSIDDVAEPWGVKVERVQMKNVEIPRIHAARDGAGGRGAAGKARPPDQGAGGSRSRGAAAPGGGNHHAQPGRARVAPNADDHGSRRRAKHHDDHYDAERIRRNGAGVWTTRRARPGSGKLGNRVSCKTAAAQRNWSRAYDFHAANAGPGAGAKH